MSDDTPFLRTILDHPHEVGPRLVFADWLEERGDPWGELIRLQCELATTYQEDKTDDYFRLQPPFFDEPVRRRIERCGRLLDKETNSIVGRCLTRFWRDAGSLSNDSNVVVEYKSVAGDLIWWREPVLNTFSHSSRLFIWKGFPERADINTETWLDWNYEIMGAFPCWYLKISDRANTRREPFHWEDTFNVIGQYVGKQLMTLDVPYFAPLNAFTAWTCNLLDAWGEAAMKHTGQPFTLKIGQAVMSGPPHSAAERWQAYCDRWLKDSNVRIVSRLEARPAGEAMPSG